jgi:hypothetical protein
MGPGNKRAEPTVDSFDFIRGEVPPPPEWPATASFDWDVQATTPPYPPGYLYVYTWSTPVFDLRPDLSSRIGTTKQGVPIWRRYARIRVGIAGGNGSNVNMNGWEVRAREYASIFDANVQGSVSGPDGPSSARPNLLLIGESDATNAFYPTLLPSFAGQAQRALAQFAPPGTGLGGGEGYPIRYYRLELQFIYRTEEELPLPPAGAGPAYAITAGVY